MNQGNASNSRFRLQCLASAAVLLSVLATALGADENGRFDDWASQASKLKDQYQAVTPAAVAEARSELRAEMRELDEYLTSGGVADGWKEYLNWQLLLEQLAEESEPDRASLHAVLEKLTANQSGLEQDQFRSVATALRRYIARLEVLMIRDAAAYHAAQMDSLADALTGYAADPTAARTHAVAQGLNWLEISDQAPDYVRGVRSLFSHPNLLLDASSRFVAAGLVQPVNYTDPIRDNILGASVTGWGRTTGTIRGQLVSDPQRAAMQLNVSGRTDANTVSRKGHVTVWSDGRTTFTGYKTLTFDGLGFAGGASRSCARAANQVRCLSAPPLIKPLARIQLARQRDKANRIAASHAVPLINRRLDEDAGAIIESANDAYTTRFRHPLLRSGAFPRQITFTTTDQELSIAVLQGADGQLGAPQPAAPFTLTHDIGVRVHETAVNNMTESLLAGRTLTDEELRVKVAGFLTMASLEQFAPAEDDEPWSVTFARRQPITVSFRDGAYTLTIAGERWSSGRRTFRALNASVTYRIESGDSRVRLVRDDEILIAPPGFVRGKGRLSPLVISARRVLQRKLDELLPSVIEPDDLVVPGPWERAGPLRVVNMAADQGWLQASWEMVSSPVTTAGRIVDGYSKD